MFELAAVVQPSRGTRTLSGAGAGCIFCAPEIKWRSCSAAWAVCSRSSQNAAGHGDTAKSSVGPGQNQPIDPGQLRSALGQKTVSDVAQQAGINEQEFLFQLSQNLPQFVDQLTPNGKVPSLQEIAAALTRKSGSAARHPVVSLSNHD